MGRIAIFRCQACSHEFRSLEGGTTLSILLRCEECDATEPVDADDYPREFHPKRVLPHTPPKDWTRSQADWTLFRQNLRATEEDNAARQKEVERHNAKVRKDWRCPRCNGSMREDLAPMCPACKSRKVEVKQVLAFLD